MSSETSETSETRQSNTPPRPAEDDQEAWPAYWAALGQPWRREPEVGERQRASVALSRERNAKEGLPPYSYVFLSRQSVEWLLAEHEDGRGPVDWSDPVQRDRWGLDLRSATLGDQDFSGLPLARTIIGASPDDLPTFAKRDRQVWRDDTASEVRERLIGLSLGGLNLAGAHLEGSALNLLDMRRANLDGAYFDEASLVGATFGGKRAQSDAPPASLAGASFRGATLEDASFSEVELAGVVFDGANLRDARMERARLRRVALSGASLRGVALSSADLQGQDLRGADLRGARLEGANLREADLAGADLRGATLDPLTSLNGARFADASGGYAALGNVRWNAVDLTVMDWTPLTRLGDETVARAPKTREGERKTRADRLAEYVAAIRANRQVALVLQRQGLVEPAGQLAYRAQVLQRELTLRQILWQRRARRLGSWLLQSFLGLLTGYGYRMGRILFAYLLSVLAFALAYFALGVASAPHLVWYEALFVSLSAFHGRVFAEQFQPGSPQIWLTAAEAICGLLVESVFIAMLTRRFFTR